MEKREGKRMRLSANEVDAVMEYRGLENAAKESGVNIDEVKHAWLKTDTSSLFVKNANFGGAKRDKFAEDLVKLISESSPVKSKNYVRKSKDTHLLVVDPADIHIGKLCSALEVGKRYDSQEAVKRVMEGVEGLLQKSNGFNIDEIAFIGGNDILHIDSPSRKTTSGTSQDTDGMWYENFLTATKLYIDVVNRLSEIAPVYFVFNPSNHDYMSGFMLAQVIEAHFRNDKNVSFDISISHRKYFTYGYNLIGTTHGDGAKNVDLGALMAHESKDWSSCKYRYIYTHHVHHKVAKDYIGVTVESLRSPSGSDSWHDRNGYTGVPQAVEAFIHHKEHGQVCRLTHIF